MRTSLVVEQLRALVLRDGAGLTDGQLLECFIAGREDAAFEALVRKHGPMVLGVCRRVLRNHLDSEDAFQATFLVLARKASSIMPREMVGNWLHGVAYRTALRVRAAAAKRRERQLSGMPEPQAPQGDAVHDLFEMLDRELNGLPEKYRAPLILCGLEGKSEKEAARHLGLPQGTLSGRLSRARALLAKRLARHGVALSLASPAVPTSLLESISCLAQHDWMLPCVAPCSGVDKHGNPLSPGTVRMSRNQECRSLVIGSLPIRPMLIGRSHRKCC